MFRRNELDVALAQEVTQASSAGYTRATTAPIGASAGLAVPPPRGAARERVVKEDRNSTAVCASGREACLQPSYTAGHLT